MSTRFLTIADVAEQLQLSAQAVRALIRTGDLPAIQVGARKLWKDPRMAGGVVLVAAAVALGAWAVDAAADTTRVYVLSKDVAPGADLTADGVLTAVEAHPGTDAYVEVGHLPDGAVATRSMSKGGAAGGGGRGQQPGAGAAAGGPQRRLQPAGLDEGR